MYKPLADLDITDIRHIAILVFGGLCACALALAGCATAQEQ